MSRSPFVFAGSLVVAALFFACSTAPKSEEGRSDLSVRAADCVAQAGRNDPSLTEVLQHSVGYAVFPKIGKGAIGVGGAYGKGIVFEAGREVGYCDVSQATIGFQLGGQSYSEIIAFETRDALGKFESGAFTVDAQATAVALKSGAGANAKYANGVVVFTMNESGLMYEASIGGQKFTYQQK